MSDSSRRISLHTGGGWWDAVLQAARHWSVLVEARDIVIICLSLFDEIGAEDLFLKNGTRYLAPLNGICLSIYRRVCQAFRVSFDKLPPTRNILHHKTLRIPMHSLSEFAGEGSQTCASAWLQIKCCWQQSDITLVDVFRYWIELLGYLCEVQLCEVKLNKEMFLQEGEWSVLSLVCLQLL